MIEIDRNPNASKLRWFAGLQVAFFALVALSVFRRTGSVALAVVIALLSLTLAAIGLARPAAIRRVYIGWMLAVYPIGWVVSHAVLAVIFYLFFTPLGVIMRWCGRDPLALRFDRSAPSYWVERRADAAVERYFRQF